MVVEAESPVCNANAERNLLKAPAADSGSDIGSGSPRSDTKGLRGVFPDCFGEGVRISASGTNTEGRSPDPLDDPDVVLGTEGPGDNERGLESSD